MPPAAPAASAAAIAIGYARVSTEGQATDGVSLDAQRARFEAWCLANDRKAERLYVDAGISGKRVDNRPELQRALDLVCRRRKSGTPAPVLVVYSLSRLARSVRDTIGIAERLDKAGADLVSLTEKIDTTSAAGKMLFRLLAVLAEFERDLISERTSSALQHMRSEGKRVGGIPYGFALDPDGVTLRAVPHEQDVIDRIVAWRTSGLTLRAIAAQLEQAKVSTKQNGRRWHPTAIADVIRRAAGPPARNRDAANALATAGKT